MAILAAEPRVGGDHSAERHRWPFPSEYQDATGHRVPVAEPIADELRRTPWDWLLKNSDASTGDVYGRIPLGDIRETTGESLLFDGTNMTSRQVWGMVDTSPVALASMGDLEQLARLDLASAERFRNLAKLEPNWDGYGAFSISAMAIQRCSALVVEIYGAVDLDLEHVFVAPLADGGLELDLEWPSGNELMVVVPPFDGAVEFLATTIDTSSGEESEHEGV